MRKLLLELPEELSPLGADKDDFLVAARTLMTAQEHVSQGLSTVLPQLSYLALRRSHCQSTAAPGWLCSAWNLSTLAAMVGLLHTCQSTTAVVDCESAECTALTTYTHVLLMAAADGAVQLNLYASIATSCSSMQQQQLVAEATVALAFQQRNPVRMLQAAGAFKLLDQTVAKVIPL